ncbi:hypothetical protein ACFQGT_04420 [Natrialbaceae archaeon GCM10025810]|uniref:hypothetical protein n=1 Tax=Halovalidus salilacus TaxID=3075124 RepID=UPI00361616D6
MIAERAVGSLPDPPGSAGARLTFLGAWFVDLLATLCFFLVPYASELNPVTVYLHDVFGLPGVVLAAFCYAAIVIVIGHVLSNPADAAFVVVVAILYVLFAGNNIVLLVFGEAVFEMIV